MSRQIIIIGSDDDHEYFADVVSGEPEPDAPPPDDAELLRLLATALEKAPHINVDMDAFMAFSLVGLLQFCTRHPDLPAEMREMALHLAKAFEEVVADVAPEAAPLLKYGYDPSHDVPYQNGQPLGPDPECPNCVGAGGPFPGGRCGFCWVWRNRPQYWPQEKPE